jgi:hypothetical protein
MVEGFLNAGCLSSKNSKVRFGGDAETHTPIRLASLAANELQALAGEKQRPSHRLTRIDTDSEEEAFKGSVLI